MVVALDTQYIEIVKLDKIIKRLEEIISLYVDPAQIKPEHQKTYDLAVFCHEIESK